MSRTIRPELPDPAHSGATAAAQGGRPVGAIANSLALSADGPLLVLTSDAHRGDTRRLAGLPGMARKRVRRADPAFDLSATAQEVGGVSRSAVRGPYAPWSTRPRPSTITSGRAPECRTRCSGRRSPSW
ncbi:hypothetical protein [Streptomyces griseoluteus]